MNISNFQKTTINKAMKAIHLISVFICFVLYSCNSGTKTDGAKVTFGIHEVVKMGEVTDSIMNALKLMDILFETNQEQPVIGYSANTDSEILQYQESNEKVKIVKTHYPVDKENKYYAIVAIRPYPLIDNSDIKRTKAKGKMVEIYFNMEGAGKWAELTRQNIGNMVAFIIDNQIYTMPLINGEIRNGTALISGLESETFAQHLSDALNY